MKTFRLQLRFLVPLVVILAGAAYLALPLMDRLTLRWFAVITGYGLVIPNTGRRCATVAGVMARRLLRP